MSALIAFIKCLRPKQWTKNLLIFAGIVFAKKMMDPVFAVRAAAAFAIFCALSGVVYIVNDILDVEKDREHPKKKKRPIASGAISTAAAGAGGVVVLIAAMTGAWFLGWHFFIVSAMYVALVTAYSVKLKHLVILDILAIAMGFLLRAVAGVEALKIPGGEAIPITPFFILTTLFLALFLAIAKRRNEIVLLGQGAGGHRRVLKDYSVEYLDVMLTVATTGVIGSYAAWSLGGFTKSTIDGGNYLMVYTMPFVLYGIFRYLWLVLRRDEGGAPEELLVEDKPLLATVALWMATVVAILHFAK